MIQNREHWLPVVGYENLYEVSNRGRARSVDRVIVQPGPWGSQPAVRRKLKGRILQQRRGEITLSRQSIRRTVGVRRLMAEAFNACQPRRTA
jgi:NUMOD4 motif